MSGTATMLKRIFAVFAARNREFMRDRGTLAWNLLMPVILVFGLAFIFGGEGRSQYVVGVLQASNEIDTAEHPFLESRFIDFVPVDDEVDGFRKIERHRLDLLVRFGDERRYWVNPESARGYFAERLLLQSDATAGGGMQKAEISGDPIRYVDWVLPGILGMNMMFSCLFGVGYVVVRYRKNGFLKRLRATPLRPAEFIIAQVGSRLVLVLAVTTVVYTGTHLILSHYHEIFQDIQDSSHLRENENPTSPLLQFLQEFVHHEQFSAVFHQVLTQRWQASIFYTLKEAQIVIEEWRRHYNTVRPHSALGYRPPAPEAIIPLDQRPSIH